MKFNNIILVLCTRIILSSSSTIYFFCTCCLGGFSYLISVLEGKNKFYDFVCQIGVHWYIGLMVKMENRDSLAKLLL